MHKTDLNTLANVIVDLMENDDPSLVSKKVSAYMVEERRVRELDALMRKVVKIRAKRSGVVEADLTSAYPLSEALKQDIIEIIGERNVIFNENIDKTLIGGVRIDAKGQLLDLTVRNRLNQLKQGAVK